MPNTLKLVRWNLLIVLCGSTAGTAATVLLFALKWATDFRDLHPQIIWALPLAGLAIGWCYWRYGNQANDGTNLILEEIHDPKETIPLRMAPFVLLGTVVTLLFGGSAGREGTAVQLGSSLADQISLVFGLSKDQRRQLLMAGAGAGFGAAIGTPIAGAIFGLEVLAVHGLKLFGLWPCLVASVTGFAVTKVLHAPHTVWPTVLVESFTVELLGYVVVAGLCFGLLVRIFIWLTHQVEHVLANMVAHPPLRPLLGGVLLVFLYYLEGSYHFVGLGIPYIQSAFHQTAHSTDAWLKMAFTTLTIGSGFKGGEFIPLMFMGTTLGSFLSTYLPVSIGLLSALGFSATFAAAANTPITCSVMAIEIFGPTISPYAFVCCYFAYLASGRPGIFKSQK